MALDAPIPSRRPITTSDSIEEERDCCVEKLANCRPSTTSHRWPMESVERCNSHPKVTSPPPPEETSTVLRDVTTSWWLLPRPITACTSGLFPPINNWRTSKSTNRSLSFVDTLAASTRSATIVKGTRWPLLGKIK